MPTDTSTLTKYTTDVTVLTADVANMWFGGLFGSTEGSIYDSDDARLAGHVHDGQHLDGHSQKIDLRLDVTSQLTNTNLADDAVTKRNVRAYQNVNNAIPEYDTIAGIDYYYLDLTDLYSTIANNGAFITVANVTSNSPGDLALDDLVFGSNALNNTNSTHDERFFFDKSKGAFRAGSVTSGQWNNVLRGSYSAAFGINNLATAGRASVMGGYQNGTSLSSTASAVGAGSNNAILGVASYIGAGNSQYIGRSDNVFIGGGDNLTISGNSDGSAIIAGIDSTISDLSENCFIGGGTDISIGSSSGQSSVVGGNTVSIGDNSPYAFVGCGIQLSIGDNCNYSTIVSGRENSIDDRNYGCFIGSGYLNRLDVNTSGSCIITGASNHIGGGDFLVVTCSIFGGILNGMEDTSTASVMFGGFSNELDLSAYSIIGGGGGNSISSTSSGPSKSPIIYAGIFSGLTNSVEDTTGGCILGGDGNTLEDSTTNYSAVLSGNSNSISSTSFNSIITGGFSNTITRTGAFIGAGRLNSIASNYSGIVSGSNNSITTGTYSALVSGEYNSISSPREYNFIGGGGSATSTSGNEITDGGCCVILGGVNNVISSPNSPTTTDTSNFIGAGIGNNITLGSDASVICGGQNNLVEAASFSLIGGGYNNVFSEESDYSSIAGGDTNIIDGDYCNILGGDTNLATGDYASIAGGSNMTNNADYGFIGGGDLISVSSGTSYVFAGGGYGNAVSGGSYSAVVGGRGNTASALTASGNIIGGGRLNTVSGGGTGGSAVVAGHSNVLDDSITAFIGAGNANEITSSSNYSSLVGGLENSLTGEHNILAGGRSNSISIGDDDAITYSAIGSGFGNELTTASRASTSSTILNSFFSTMSDSSYCTILSGLNVSVDTTFYGTAHGRACVIDGTTYDEIYGNEVWGYYAEALNVGQQAIGGGNFAGSSDLEGAIQTSVIMMGGPTSQLDDNYENLYIDYPIPSIDYLYVPPNTCVIAVITWLVRGNTIIFAPDTNYVAGGTSLFTINREGAAADVTFPDGAGGVIAESLTDNVGAVAGVLRLAVGDNPGEVKVQVSKSGILTSRVTARIEWTQLKFS